MKKILTILGFAITTASFSQITVTSNLPSTINAGTAIETEVKINKGAVGNFAKYQMDVPAGYIVSSVDVKGGNFTFENQRAKIVWVSVPGEPEFAIKFNIQANSDAASPGTFAQKFYYLENNEKKEVEAAPVVVTIGGGAVAVNSTPVETVTSTTPTETKPVETVTSTTPTETKPVETVTSSKPVETVKSTTPTETKTSASSAVTGMTFKVQLGAFSTQPNKSRFSGAGNVSIDNIGGMYKVTTGNFKTKEEAIKYRDELQSKGFSGFIVKYQNGQRIN